MTYYRKKPIVVQVFRFYVDPMPDWFMAGVRAGAIWINNGSPQTCTIHTLEGNMRANIGDWIIRSVKGEIYPCKPDIFAETYEPTYCGIAEFTKAGAAAWADVPDAAEWVRDQRGGCPSKPRSSGAIRYIIAILFLLWFALVCVWAGRGD